MRAGRGAGPPAPVGVVAAVLLLLSGAGPALGSEDIVVGCGGFVKSDVEINYSLIEVSVHPRPGPDRPASRCYPAPVSRPLWATVASFQTLGSFRQPLAVGVLPSAHAVPCTGSATLPRLAQAA